MSAPSLDALRDALAASWDEHTAFRGITVPGNPAYGQCYPTARLVEHFHPELAVVVGEVDTGAAHECHFWNIGADGTHVDLSWQQFPPGSVVTRFEHLDSALHPDSPATIARCDLLLRRVQAALAR